MYTIDNIRDIDLVNILAMPTRDALAVAQLVNVAIDSEACDTNWDRLEDLVRMVDVTDYDYTIGEYIDDAREAE